MRLDNVSLAVFAVSTLLVVAGIALGREFLPPARGQGPARSWMDGFVCWDGTYYRAIAQDGYSYRAGRQSTIHFMPLYPLLGRGVGRLTGLPAEAALVLTSHACFLAALCLLGAYTERRYGALAPAARARAVVALGFLPTSVFFHLAYTESLFLLLVLGQLVLIERGAHPLLVALVVCLGVVARPVGVAMVLPLALYAWRHGGGGERSAGWVCIAVPAALLGLAAFMAYCGWAFADPLVFARGRDDLWRVRTRVPAWEKVWLLLSLEPLWGMFVPTSTGYWGRLLTPLQACFNTHLAGPFYFLLALALMALGALRRHLNPYELSLMAGLLLIPYWMTSYDSAMISMARYVSVIAPLYSFGGLLLAKAPAPLLGAAAALGGLCVAVFAAQFAQWYFVI